ncbi:hypothetical protein [Leyella stercorea]|uniref:hypothetical protein n=1 Tax=Leyella stercorea TaxID=363265 RepID=UPI003AF1E191
MNIMKYMCLAGLFFPIAAVAQQDKTLCDFETPESYKSVRAYDTCPTSPFNLSKLTGNVQVVENDLNAVDDALGYAPNESSKILGVQRSRYGSNTFGALVELKEPLALKRETQYVHVKFYSTQDAPVMLIGLGNREDRPWQPATTEQFWSVPTSNVHAGAWQDVVFPIMGANGINIKSLLVVVDRQSPHNQMSDFAVFIDDITLSSKANPFFSKSVYPINYEESTAHTRGDERYVKNVKLGTQSVAINQNTDKKLYFNKTENIFLAKPGETVTPTIDWKGIWMHGYAYLDKDDNGKFDVDYTNSGITNARDLVSYSYYKDKNSAGSRASSDCGVGLPSFKIDDDMKPGIYRMRYKVDWDNVDPGGSTATGNLITGNGGALIDVLVNIHNDEVNLFRATEENGGGLNGDVLLADGKQLTGRTTPFGQAFVIKSKPAEGFVLDYMKIRHGYNLEGASTKNENQQWKEFVVQASQFVNNEYTIPANCVDGDIRIVPFFKSDPTSVNDATVKAFEVKAGQGEMTLTAAVPTHVDIVSVQGSTLFNGTVEGTQTICVHKGVYVVNGEKVLVK